MFYRVVDNRIYDYADYEFNKDCLYSNICTMAEFQKNSDMYLIKNGVLDFVPNYQELVIQKRKEQFEKEFFNTSLGWIRRQVNMKDGSKRDFLADLLLPIKTGMEMGQNVEIITYRTQDFSKELDLYYIESLQEVKLANLEFIQECLFQTVRDFNGTNTGVNIGVNIGVNPDANLGNNLEEAVGVIQENDIGGGDGI